MTANPHDDNRSDDVASDMSLAVDVQSNEPASPEDPRDVDHGRELFVMPASTTSVEVAPSLGSRLRAAREARGWTVDEAALKLRLPQRVLATLERGDFERIEHDVYLRGYLASYARLLGVPTTDVDSLLRDRGQNQPALVATGRISRSRYLYERYSVPAVYVVLTGLIVAPAVWLASHGRFEQNLARLAPLDDKPARVEQPVVTTPGPTPGATVPLDAPSTAEAAPPATSMVDTVPPAAESAAPAQPSPRVESPLMASMVPSIKHEPMPAAPAGSHRVQLKLKDASWVELVGADGRKLEYGLLAAGTEKSYTTDQIVSIRLGNAIGAELVVDGKPVDLAAFRRSNVAHLKLVGGAAQAPTVTSDN
ncbi:helix-turn-helix domain-containing protein [Tahibacter amnicola]|uniref:DUF4115 domain-containing protein n=1 Tax=Tahibacter amnicola TaxID=2976241 RepID=A0ABY6B960_9GAMM|nr:helix-turn-helix domain-containing protein [Tahibacter amnicola]UXI66606.1 DUF4115 domain-containing protein [Tahibacter amnicola]